MSPAEQVSPPLFTCHAFSHPPKVELAAAPYLCPAAIQVKVDQVWQTQRQQRGEALTDGPLYHLAEISPQQLLIQPSRYRYYVARLHNPHWAEQGLSIQPLAVTALLHCQDGIILGQRSEHVITNPLHWELAPAGGVNQPDPQGALYEELREELGLQAEQCHASTLLGLVGNRENGVHDLLYKLSTNLNAQAIMQSQQQRGTQEYQQLACLPPDQLPSFLKKHRHHVVPELIPMLTLAQLLPPSFSLSQA
ncbi:NUDIX hydrolase [Magnetococcus sp. PR-3]|uniref:NUDIX hydrolase n=1 Tax=Magnetococcus sp. PR-3 TaxID=3120355 RepID=UPI002FCE5696